VKLPSNAASGGPADVSRAKLLKKFDQNFLLGTSARQKMSILNILAF
jgi:hypothetical protein